MISFGLTIAFLKWFIVFTTAIDPNCDFSQDLALGQEYFISNQEYPNLYRPFTSCRWNARSPFGTVIVLSCDDVEIPNSQYCQSDRLSVSTVGDQSLRNSRSYCGKSSFTRISERNLLTVGLFSSGQTPGGKFVCSIAAMRAAPTWCSCSYQEEQTKIVGGQETRVNEFPWMSAILNRFTFDAFCGANIISERYALTTAHCLNRQTPNDVGLLVGDHNLAIGSDTIAAAVYPIMEFIKHPRYNTTDESNDIALLKTSRSIVFSTAVGPVCLPFRYGRRNFVNDVVTVLGWGFKDFSGDKSNTLQEVNLTVVANSYCAQATHKRIHQTQMCTYTPGQDSCISDSGGPLLWRNSQSGRFQLVGLVSFGLSCATVVPAVNTRVTLFLSWVVSATSDTLYCIKQ